MSQPTLVSCARDLGEVAEGMKERGDPDEDAVRAIIGQLETVIARSGRIKAAPADPVQPSEPVDLGRCPVPILARLAHF